jgi:hypothetical protein
MVAMARRRESQLLIADTACLVASRELRLVGLDRRREPLPHLMLHDAPPPRAVRLGCPSGCREGESPRPALAEHAAHRLRSLPQAGRRWRCDQYASGARFLSASVRSIPECQ